MSLQQRLGRPSAEIPPPFTLVTLHRRLLMGEGGLLLVVTSQRSIRASCYLSPTCMHDPCKLLPCHPYTVHLIPLTSAAPSGTSVPPWPAAGPGQQHSTALEQRSAVVCSMQQLDVGMAAAECRRGAVPHGSSGGTTSSRQTKPNPNALHVNGPSICRLPIQNLRSCSTQPSALELLSHPRPACHPATHRAG